MIAKRYIVILFLYRYTVALRRNVVPGDNKNPSRLELTEIFVIERALNSLTRLRQGFIVCQKR